MASPAERRKTSADFTKDLQRHKSRLYRVGRGAGGTGGGTTGASGGGDSVNQQTQTHPNTVTLNGSIAFTPILRTLDSTKTIDITNDGISSSNVVISSSGNNTELNWINGAKNAGQMLFMKGIQTRSFTLKQAVRTLSDDGVPQNDADGNPLFTGNINTKGGVDADINNVDTIILSFDSTSNRWNQVTPSNAQEGEIMSDLALPIKYGLTNLGNVGDIVQSINTTVPDGTQGYQMTLTGDIGISLNSVMSEAKLFPFYLVIRQDSTGGHEITTTDAAIVNANATQINSLLNKAAGDETIFILTNPIGSRWHLSVAGIGTVTGGSASTNFSELSGQIALDQIPDNLITDQKISGVGIEKLGASAENSAHVLISGGGVTDNTWGTLDNVIGGLSVGNIKALVANNGQVPRVVNGTPEWSHFNLSDLNDLPSTSPVEGQLLLRDSVGGVVQWTYGKLTNEFVNDDALSIDKLSSSASDAGHVLISGGTAPNSWGTLANIVGNMPITRLGTVSSDTNHILISGGTVGSNYWGTLANAVGNLPATKITSGVFDADRIPELDPDKITSVSSDAGHVLLAGTPNTWGTLANILGSLPITRLGSVASDSNHILISGGTGSNYWGTLANAVGNLPASKITSGTLDQDRIPVLSESKIPELDPDKIQSSAINAGHVLLAGTPNTWGTLVNILGRINATTQIAGGSGVAGRFLRATATGAEWSNTTVSIASLNDIGDVNAPAPASNAVLKIVNGVWVPGVIVDSNIENVSADKITTGTISANRMPSVYQSALASYQTSEGSIETRLDTLESNSGGVGELDDLSDVNAQNPGSNTVLKRFGSNWVAGQVTNDNISAMDASKLTGTLSTNRFPSTYRNALSGYNTNDGSIQSRLNDLESGSSGGVSSLNDLSDVSIFSTPSTNTVLVRGSGGWGANFIGGSSIFANAITSSHLATGSVGNSELATNAVTSTKISPSAVSSTKIQNSAVTNSKIGTNAVTSAKIGTGAVSSSKLASGAVGNAELASNAVSSSKLQSNSVSSTHIVSGAVSSTRLGSSAVTSAKIATGAVSRSKLASGAVHDSEVSDVSASKITGSRFSRFSPSFEVRTFTNQDSTESHRNKLNQLVNALVGANLATRG